MKLFSSVVVGRTNSLIIVLSASDPVKVVYSLALHAFCETPFWRLSLEVLLGAYWLVVALFYVSLPYFC